MFDIMIYLFFILRFQPKVIVSQLSNYFITIIVIKYTYYSLSKHKIYNNTRAEYLLYGRIMITYLLLFLNIFNPN